VKDGIAADAMIAAIVEGHEQLGSAEPTAAQTTQNQQRVSRWSVIAVGSF